MFTITDQMESFIHAQSYKSEEELKQQHLFTKLELDAMKMEVIQNRKKERELHEELQRIREDVKQLWQLLQEANNDRSILLQLLQLALQAPAELNPSVTQAKNSSIAPSIVDSPLDTLCYLPGSSTVNQIFTGEEGFSTASLSSPAVVPSVTLEIDPLGEAIFSRVMSKALPQKGKLLQAVKESTARLQGAKLFMSQPVPNFQNSAPLQSMKFSPFVSTDFGASGIMKESMSVQQQYQATFFNG